MSSLFVNFLAKVSGKPTHQEADSTNSDPNDKNTTSDQFDDRTTSTEQPNEDASDQLAGCSNTRQNDDEARDQLADRTNIGPNGDDASAAKREKHNQRRRARREAESEEDAERRREKDKLRKREERARRKARARLEAEYEEDAERRRERDKIRKREARATMNAEKKEEIREKNKLALRELQARNDEDAERRREKNKLRKREERARRKVENGYGERMNTEGADASAIAEEEKSPEYQRTHEASIATVRATDDSLMEAIENTNESTFQLSAVATLNAADVMALNESYKRDHERAVKKCETVKRLSEDLQRGFDAYVLAISKLSQELEEEDKQAALHEAQVRHAIVTSAKQHMMNDKEIVYV